MCAIIADRLDWRLFGACLSAMILGALAVPIQLLALDVPQSLSAMLEFWPMTLSLVATLASIWIAAKTFPKLRAHFKNADVPPIDQATRRRVPLHFYP